MDTACHDRFWAKAGRERSEPHHRFDRPADAAMLIGDRERQATQFPESLQPCAGEYLARRRRTGLPNRRPVRSPAAKAGLYQR